MPIAIAASRQTVANAYAALGNFLGVCIGDPGTNPASIQNETSGSGYTRVAFTWSPGTDGTETGSPAIINVPIGMFNYVLLASTVTGGTMVDKTSVTPTNMSTPGQLTITPNYLQK